MGQSRRGGRRRWRGAAVTNIFSLGLRSPASEVAYYNAAQRIIAAQFGLRRPGCGLSVRHAGTQSRRVLVFVGKYQWLFIGCEPEGCFC